MSWPKAIYTAALLALVNASAGAADASAPPAASAADPLAPLLTKPLYQFTEAEVGLYLPYAQKEFPNLRDRIVHLARKNIGQPYEIYLLGEMPFETYDPQPIYCLTKSDCLVFTEHTYAMALSRDWSGFMRMLQRIRYRDGQLGVVTRNHYTEVDWNSSNRWLVREITAEVADGHTLPFAEKIDRTSFFKNRYKLAVTLPVEDHRDAYLPIAEIARAYPHLRDGDFVNVVRGAVAPNSHDNVQVYGGNAWVGHTGLIAHRPDGTVTMIHSAEPQVREEPLADFIARSEALAKAPGAKQRLLGFKFLRLNEDPWTELRQLDGTEAPKVTLPGGGTMGK